MSETTRGWVYRIVTSLLAVAAIYGFVNTEQVGAWTNVAGALIGLLASVNTTVSKKGDE